MLLAIVVFWVLGLVPALDIRNWGALVPDLMNLKTCRFLLIIKGIWGVATGTRGRGEMGRDGTTNRLGWEGKERRKKREWTS